MPMSFEKILEKRGVAVKIVKIQKQNVEGIIEPVETDIIETKALVQPISKEELIYWKDLGFAKAQIKAYFKPDENIEIGDIVEIDGKRYHVKTFENHTAIGINGYKVAILGEEL